MPKRIKHEDDPVKSALRVVRKATGDDTFPNALPEPSKQTISDVMAALGRRGGRKGGRARAANLSPERLSEIAQAAARARWGKRRKKSRAS